MPGTQKNIEKELIDMDNHSGKNFIELAIDEDISEGGVFTVCRCTPGFRRNRTAICISDMPKHFHRFRNGQNTTEYAICGMDDTNPVKEDTEYVEAIKRI